MNEVFVLVFVLVIALSYAALVVLLATFLRGLTQRGRQVMADSPLRTMITGIVAWVVFGGLAAWLYFQVSLASACVAVIVPSLVCLAGAPGLYTHIGSRIAALRTHEASDLWCVIVGSLVALTAALFPFVGWFLVLPLLLAAEFGVGFRSLLR